MTYSMVVRCEALALVAQGVSCGSAAAAVGVSATTVKQWRADSVGVMERSAAESGRYLSREERYEIARLRDAGWSICSIADRLGRSASTVSRELSRNADGQGGYQPEQADQLALRRRRRPRSTRLQRCPRLRARVQQQLKERLSPEQISGRLRLEFGDDESMRISHESIYQAIYVHPRGELKRELRAHLRTGRDRRRPRNTRRHRGGAIIDPVSIHDRPAEIEGRLVPGHYEGDLIVGPLGAPAVIATLVERSCGYLRLIHLPLDRSAETVTAALIADVEHGPWTTRSITWDRGAELAQHKRFLAQTGIQIYFADPHAPWQRGSNENTNGLLREYFPTCMGCSECRDRVNCP
ncbi:MAG TPA: IS30 family transposase [Actinomycetota bacterium]|nr:IS30 family transposase [Actinomycetota bacterium]